MKRFFVKSRRLKVILGLSLLIALAGYFGFFSTKSEKNNIGKVEKLDLIQRVTIAGVVAARKKSVIMAPYNGYVRKVFVSIGDQVKKGDPLVIVSQSAHASEEGFPLRSPLEGTVVQTNKSEGEYVKENDNKDFIMRIDDLEKLYVYANAPEMDRVKIKKGQEVLIKASALTEKSYKGEIRDLSLAANEKEQWGRSQVVEFPIRIEITERDEALKPGMSVVLDVITAKKEKVLTLRHEFIRKDQEQYYVLDHKGHRHDIKIGLQNDEGAEILEGLKEGDQIQQIDFADLVQSRR